MPFAKYLLSVALGVVSVVPQGCGGGGQTPSTTPIPTPTPAATSLTGTVLLGSPTPNSIKLNIYSADQSGSVSVQYGTSAGSYTQQTTAVLAAGVPLPITLDRLSPDTRYYYRVSYQASGGIAALSDGYSFHTARPPGSTFTFTVQADSHLDENSDLDLYRKTLSNVLADAPDFHVDLGDTFMCERSCTPLTLSQPAQDQATVDTRYAYERGNFGLISHSVPLFLTNGNHEGEAGWLADGTSSNLAIWTTKARQQLYLNPVPDGFYTGDSSDEAFVGKRASWYSWNWGDALFIVLDPYWNTSIKSNDGWSITLGQNQYAWLQQTLATSTAKWKFVFVHSLVGGLDGQLRGGIEAAPYFEWGGRNSDATAGFSQMRPGWLMPIHQLLTRYGVTAVFHGHDHLYARQNLDGIAYQEVPQPSARNTSSGPNLAAQYHYASGTILSSSGHLRVTVAPDHVLVQYVRAWLPSSETDQRKNGQVDDSWTVTAH